MTVIHSRSGEDMEGARPRSKGRTLEEKNQGHMEGRWISI